jgi:tetratricopeptide (TPR) repeat protein
MQGSTRIDELRQKFHENPRRYFAPLANEYRKAGDPEQAIAICRAHLAQQPGHMSGHVVYGQALYDARRTDEARTVFEKALELDPDNAIVLKQLGDIARENGDTTEARHWYSRAIDVDPNDRETAAYVAELTEPSSEEAVGEQPVAETAAASEQQEPQAQQSEEPEAEEPQPREPQAAEPQPEEPQLDAPMAATPAFEAEVPAVEPAREPEIEKAAASLPPADVHEPEVHEPEVHEPEASDLESADSEVPWRKTPPAEESPFVTRTMAEVYASQGYRDAALDVYRQLALQHPDDKEISERIEALEKTPEAPVESVPAPELIPFEPVITDMPVESEHDTIVDLPDSSVYAPSSEDLNLDVAATPPEGQPHFTETELSSGGDRWDSDSWGAGFDSEEDVNLDFDSPDVPKTEATAPAIEEKTDEKIQENVGEKVEEPQAELVTTAEAERAPSETAPEEAAPVEAAPEEIDLSAPIAEDLAEEPVIEAPQESAARAVEPLPVEAPSYEEPSYEQPAPANEESYFESAEEPADASHVVAYSPQLPDEEDLPQDSPKGPTVREFFATLGAFKPSARAGSSITAHAAVPSAPETGSTMDEPAPATSDYPLASDAFATLCSTETVSDEDSRAAFALSGALGSSAPATPPIAAPQEPQAPAESAASPASTQESEEDIRRFREWLDGLAES